MTVADRVTKTQFLIEPFHRMFSLDNLVIQFPHAEIERVPVSEQRGIFFVPRGADLLTGGL